MLQSAKVLIVDDEPHMSQSIEMLLSKHGYSTRISSNGQQALKYLSEEAFDLILLDLYMPDMDGFQVMKQINKKYPDVLVIIITGHASTESAIAALRGGAYDFLKKPFEYEELLMTVQNAVNHKNLIAENKRVEAALRIAHDDLEKRVKERTVELAEANTNLMKEIAERKKAESALKESSEKIKQFAYSVSHDLKSPAIAIHGLTKSLYKNYMARLDEKGTSYCRNILNASEQIAKLAEKINIYISAKESPITIETVNIKEVFQILKEEFMSEITIRNIRCLEPDTIPEINADRLCIFRVFRNFLDNALKYGGDGLNEIEIGYNESQEFHILSFRDNGVGMNKEDSDKIFSRFTRNKTSKGIEGTGLGLAIVKEIAEKHQGDVWFEPCQTTGMTFYFSISKTLTFN